jgi:ABC-type branched-subunit amino acid transport system substrate-binding protein
LAPLRFGTDRTDKIADVATVTDQHRGGSVGRGKWVAALAALVLVAGACGGDDDDDDTAVGDTTTSAAEGDTTTTASGGDDLLGDDTTTTVAGEGTETPTDGRCASPDTAFQSDGTYTAADGTETALEAGEIGVTADTITIGVYAAVDNPFAPGLAEGNRDGVYIWRDWINQNCGLAGRNVEVQFFDTKLDIAGTEWPAAQAAGCENVLAFVGGYELFDANVDTLSSCADAAGAPTGLPDLSVVIGEPTHALNPTTYGVIPSQIISGMADVGAPQYLLEQFGPLRGVFLASNDLPSAHELNIAGFDGIVAAGVELVQIFDVGGREENYDPFTQALIDGDANYAQSGLAVNSTVRWRQNAAQLAPDLDVTWFCTSQCYDANLFAAGNDVVEGTYVSTLTLPFEEADSNPYMQAYLAIAEEGDYKTDSLGFQAFVAGLAMMDTIDAIVAEQGPNAITRQALLDGLSNLNDYEAYGLTGPTDIGDRQNSGCTVLLQAQGGEFVRVYPEEPGTYNCEQDNRIQVRDPQPVG